jgi:MFS family permease
VPPDPARERSPIAGISLNVFILGVVSFCTDASTEMIYPLIPLFLTQTLGAPMAVLGVIEGLAEATASVLKGVSGWVSDRVGLRRPLVIGGYGLAALAKPLLALAGGWPMALAARVLDRFGKGLRGTPRDALIADSSEPALRGRAFGFHRSADQAGAVLGPLLALPLLSLFHQNYRAVFVVAVIPAAIGVATLVAVRETGRRGKAVRATPADDDRREGNRGQPGPSPRRTAEAVPRLQAASWGTGFRGFLGAMLLFALGNSSDVFLIVRARQVGLTPQQIVLLFAAFNLTYVLSAYPAGVVSDRIGRRRVMVAGLGVFALVYLGFGLVGAPFWVCVLFLVYGLYQGLTDGTSRALVVDLVPPEHRATALGFYSMATGLATFLASAIGGLLWQWCGAPATFLYGAVLAAGAALLLAKPVKM